MHEVLGDVDGQERKDGDDDEDPAADLPEHLFVDHVAEEHVGAEDAAGVSGIEDGDVRAAKARCDREGHEDEDDREQQEFRC